MIIAFLISLFAGLSTALGALIILFNFKEKNINKIIVFSLGLSISIMIGISITELIPEAFFNTLKHYGITKGQYITFFVFVIGYFLIVIIDKTIKNTNDLYKLGILSMIALIVHNLPEGVATFMASYKDVNLGMKLGISIMLHNIPEGLMIAVPIYYSTKSKLKGIKYALLSGLTEPVGALITYFFLKDYIKASVLDIILLFVGAIMITLSIRELLPKATNYDIKPAFNIGMIIGVIIIIINFLNIL